MGYYNRRYRYIAESDDAATANLLVSEHQAGSTVEVYYNPQDPVDSVMSSTVRLGDVVALFFFASVFPFTLSLLFWLSRQIDWLWDLNRVAGGAKLIQQGIVIRVRLPRFHALTMAMLATAILWLIAGVLVALGLPAMPALALVLAGGVAVYVWLFLKVHSGSQDLVIDEQAQVVHLPLTYGRRIPQRVSFEEIKAVILEKVEHRQKDDSYYTYLVVLELADGSRQQLTEVSESRSEGLAKWLKQKFGLRGLIHTVEHEP